MPDNKIKWGSRIQYELVNGHKILSDIGPEPVEELERKIEQSFNLGPMNLTVRVNGRLHVIPYHAMACVSAQNAALPKS